MKTRIFHCLVLGLLIAAIPPAARAVEPIHALLICGGCCHDYDAQKIILTEGISARANVTWDILHEGGSARTHAGRYHEMSIYKKPDWAKGYDVVVHDECFGDVSNAVFVEHIARAHFDGVPAVMIHCAIHSYRHSSTDRVAQAPGSKLVLPRPGAKIRGSQPHARSSRDEGFPRTLAGPRPR